MWAFLPLVGLAMVVIANALRARRTNDINCMGHFFVAADQLTVVEQILNRSGIAVFVVGVVVSLLT